MSIKSSVNSCKLNNLEQFLKIASYSSKVVAYILYFSNIYKSFKAVSWNAFSLAYSDNLVTVALNKAFTTYLIGLITFFETARSQIYGE